MKVCYGCARPLYEKPEDHYCDADDRIDELEAALKRLSDACDGDPPERAVALLVLYKTVYEVRGLTGLQPSEGSDE
jgi:hypothetical protein